MLSSQNCIFNNHCTATWSALIKLSAGWGFQENPDLYSDEGEWKNKDTEREGRGGREREGDREREQGMETEKEEGDQGRDGGRERGSRKTQRDQSVCVFV